MGVSRTLVACGPTGISARFPRRAEVEGTLFARYGGSGVVHGILSDITLESTRKNMNYASDFVNACYWGDLTRVKEVSAESWKSIRFDSLI